ncbi:hypothetical protein DRW07_06045 [Alteromonas sediminis]|uniref:Uncharacterized protein n=1 Tax=Alteromonas sediminis TaxID=2259342 RepID=A0A3N5Y1N0_9ALTE|nr:hypothetical protein [Alteromonas sediminis]RPJ67100.1 hypothetical protein DRW07_06045 [Alteromonas sediminis]
MEVGSTNAAAIAQLATEPRSTQTSQPEQRESVSLETPSQQSDSSQASNNSNERLGSRIDTFV